MKRNTGCIWGSWSPCTLTCGVGSHRYRNDPENPFCPTELETCNIQVSSPVFVLLLQACPVDCVVSAWGSWGSCSVTCGSGGQTRRTRTILVDAANGGAACPSLTNTQACSEVVSHVAFSILMASFLLPTPSPRRPPSPYLPTFSSSPS